MRNEYASIDMVMSNVCEKGWRWWLEEEMVACAEAAKETEDESALQPKSIRETPLLFGVVASLSPYRYPELFLHRLIFTFEPILQDSALLCETGSKSTAKYINMLS